MAPGLSALDRTRNKAMQLLRAGDHAGAAAAFETVLRKAPDDIDVLKMLGVIRGAQQVLGQAEILLSRAIRLAPGDASAHYNLGLVHLKARDYDKAIAALTRAAALAPDVANVHGELGRACEKARRPADAIAAFARADALDPSRNWLTPLVNTRRSVCDWSNTQVEDTVLVGPLPKDLAPPAPFLVVNLIDDPQVHARVAEATYRHDHARLAPRAPKPHPRPDAGAAERRIRVGYVSNEFHEHAVAFQMAELYELHDRTQLEVLAFSYGPSVKSSLRSRIAKGVDRFVDASGRPGPAIAEEIRRQRVDILVDLKGYTRDLDAAILAHRPAPIQVQYLGYPGPMMSPDYDYAVVDPIVVTQEAKALFKEALCILPVPYQVNDRKAALPPPATDRAAHGLPASGPVLCCFNNPIKIAPEMFARWMRILAAVPDGVLWLVDGPAPLAENLRRHAAAAGIAPERLVLAPKLPLADHLARLPLADLMLDTLPYNGHATTANALWVGVPVLTTPGRSFASRVSASLLTAHGLPELIAASPDAYEAQAVALARDPARLAALKARTIANRATHALFDSDRFRRNIEAGYRAMWRRWCEGLPPGEIVVAGAQSR